MRRHEIELIAALAEGSLEDEAEARALVSSSPAHRAEYQAQLSAIEALRSLPTARLTDDERSALHREVWSALRTESAPKTSTSRWYYRWSLAGAAVLVVAVGLGALVNQGGTDDAGTARLDSAELAEDGADTAAESIEEDSGGAAYAPADTTEAATEGIISDQASSDFFREIAARTRTGTFSTAGDSGADEQAFAAAKASCLEESGLDGYEMVGQVAAETDEERQIIGDAVYLIAVPADSALDETTPVVFVDSETCVITYTED